LTNLVLQSRIIKNSKKTYAPVIYTEQGVLKHFCQYMLDNSLKSQSWKNKASQAVLLLLDYAESKNGQFKSPQQMFRAFTDDIYDGTIDENGDDQSDLRWHPKALKTANSLIHHISLYSDWLYTETDEKTALLNPPRLASNQERICNLAAYHNRESRAFLRHTFNQEKALEQSQYTRSVSRRKGAVSDAEPLTVFNNDVAQELITKGFWRNSVFPEAPEQCNLRNVLITMLLHYTGLRVSEVFHIFLADICQDPVNSDSVLITVNHPIYGDAPSYWRNSDNSRKNHNRRDYLHQKYGLEDRLTSIKNSYHAGYKSRAFKSFYLYFFPSEAGVLWMTLWRYYLTYQRESDDNNLHPFAFTNRKGAPASLPLFVRAHANALIKLGYTPSKTNGLNVHAHRHWFGTILTKLGVDPLVIKKVMHHCDVESQQQYIAEARNQEISNVLSDAWSRETKTMSSTKDQLEYGYKDVDPLGLFSGSNPIFK
jgi:integrase